MAIQKAIIPDPKTGQLVEKLVVDGKLDMESLRVENSWEVRSGPTFFRLLDHACNDPLFDSCYGFYYDNYRQPWVGHPIALSISGLYDKYGNSDVAEFSLGIHIDLFLWDKPYSFNAVKACYAEYFTRFPNIEFDLNAGDGEFIHLSTIVEDRTKPLRFYFDRLFHCLRQLKEAEQTLLPRASPDGPECMTAAFNFRPEIRSACNQYLMYFGQFLEDLGILADTSLKEHMNEVLFTVTPHDKDQALDVIYEALDVFLHAPDSELADEMSDLDFAHYQWKHNMYHLKSQLELAKALIQAKDTTILVLKDALKIANCRIQLQSTLPVAVDEAAEKENEDILGGAVSITRLKGKGFTINLPRIIRKLRRKK